LQTINNATFWPQGWGRKTSIMGIINLTPDSFSDGGDFFSTENALIQATKFISSGVDIIDIGAQSTRPGAKEVGSRIEIERLIPTLKALRNNFPSLLISVDTFNSTVAHKALLNGANWINDVTGGRRDSKILDVVAQFKSPFVITHSKGNSQNMNKLNNYDNLIDDIISDLKILTNKALSKGVMKEKIIWDPGLGFAKDTGQNINILKNLERFKKYGYPILIGASRKRFVGEVINKSIPKERDIGSLAVSCLCSLKKVELVRVHNVDLNFQVLKMADKISR
tara:strand:- start:3337 stop:4179 length:843 start_codon:yes stop_codon:yes gene_type:complete